MALVLYVLFWIVFYEITTKLFPEKKDAVAVFVITAGILDAHMFWKL